MEPDRSSPGVGDRVKPGNRGLYALIIGLAALAVVIVLMLSPGYDADETAPPATAPGALEPQ